MPKKKTIPPPDDFSSEFMEIESGKELSEQQVEAAGSDYTETPLAEPPEVDLGSGDVSGTAEVEENEPDAENTADAAEIVPVSDEKAEDPEYDSILQELNSSTPAPLDSSGENALDALLLEENVENVPPAEDETESADGEAAPQPTAPPAPAGRRDSYILTVDAKDRIETEEERREVIWHEIKTSHIAGRILTGTLDGVEQTPSGRTIVVVDYKGYRIAIPLKEMMLYSGPVPYGAKYKPFMERMNSILATMLTAEIDFIVRGLDNTARSVVASRKAAMLRKRQTFYLDTNEDGVPMIYEGRVVQARVIGVAEKVLRVEVFGVECTIFARDLSAAWFGDAREYYSVGDRVLVRVLTIDRDDINHISITADIRSVSSAANQSNLDTVPAEEDGEEDTAETWYIYTIRYNGEAYFADTIFALTDEQKDLAENYAENLSLFLGDGLFQYAPSTNTTTALGDVRLTDGETEVIYFNQLDERYANQPYGTDHIGGYGCGPTSMAIVVSSLTGETVDPAQMAQWAYEHGYWCSKSGSYHTLIPGAAQAWGLSVEGCTASEPQRILDALADGKLVVALMTKGHFTKSGHFIVLRGVQDEKILVADPASYRRSQKAWDLSIILNEASRRAGAGGPFWIIG